ncbi:MAG: glycosyltransferase family 1 protein [Salinivirgaceae bacterium]|nr:MAG: glycosyltransferase family 1 protein [Salinivirgaceae bacterium]
MRIAVNVRLLLKDRLEGIGWFTYENLKRITQSHPEHEFLFIFDRPYDKSFIFSNNIKPIVVGLPTRHAFLHMFWFEIQIPRILKKYKADLFLSPDGFLSLKTKVPQIGVIHDINFAHRPQDIPGLYRKYYNYYFPRFAKIATRLATVSEYSKNDIATTYGVDKSKIDVVYNGANEMYVPIKEEEQIKTRVEFSDGKPYFLFVGAFSARKNIHNLLKAFDKFKESDKQGFKLVLVGKPLFRNDDISIEHQKMQFKEDVMFLGRQNPENLHKLLASAHALAFVPFFEGFGIPVAEAIQCHTPAICSNVTSVPEVGLKAALYVDPTKVEEISEAMLKISTDNTLRNELVEHAKEQSGIFTWDKSAERLWGTIETVMREIND